jgi:hypothetical protein
MDQGLEGAVWATRREIIRAFVKHVEVSDEQIRIVYRVNTVPFVKAPKGHLRKIVVDVSTTILFPTSDYPRGAIASNSSY